MAARAVAFVLSITLSSTSAFAQHKTPPVPKTNPTTMEAPPRLDMDVPPICLSSQVAAVRGCALAAFLFQKGLKWEKRAKELYIDNEATKKKLAAAEEALANKPEIPEAGGLSISPWLAITISILAAGAGAAAGALL